MDHVHAVEPAKSVFETKAQIRRATEAAGIPYTYVPANFFASFILPILLKSGGDKVTILGDGNVKGSVSAYKIIQMNRFNAMCLAFLKVCAYVC